MRARASLVAFSSLIVACGGDPAPPVAPPPAPPIVLVEDVPIHCPEQARADSQDTDAILGKNIAKICFRGIGPELERTLREKLTEHEGEPFSRERAAREIPAMFATGLVDDARLTAVPAGAKGIILDLEVAPRARVTEIAFHGASVFGDAALAKSFPVKAGAPLDHSKLREALRALEGEYVGRGYPGAHTTFAIEPDTGGSRVRVDIEEGALVHVQKLVFVGLEKIKEQDLLKVTEEKIGDPYVPDRALRDKYLISALLYDRGLVQSDVDLKETIAVDAATMTFTIKEGPVFKVGKVLLAGDNLGEEKAIVASLELKPKAVFSRAIVLKDVEALKTRAQARHQNVDVNPESDLDVVRHVVDVTFRVTPNH